MILHLIQSHIRDVNKYSLLIPVALMTPVPWTRLIKSKVNLEWHLICNMGVWIPKISCIWPFLPFILAFQLNSNVISEAPKWETTRYGLNVPSVTYHLGSWKWILELEKHGVKVLSYYANAKYTYIFFTQHTLKCNSDFIIILQYHCTVLYSYIVRFITVFLLYMENVAWEGKLDKTDWQDLQVFKDCFSFMPHTMC